MPTDEDLMTIRAKLHEMKTERDRLQGAVNHHRKRTPLLEAFIRKYAYHTKKCDAPRWRCSCGYSTARAALD